MTEQYRRDYPGEFVITSTVFKNGKKEQEREWVDNPIEVSHDSNLAVCFMKDTTLKDTLYNRIVENRGKLLGREHMVSYGVEDVWNHCTPNFLVSMKDESLKEMIEQDYAEKSVVYTSTRLCLDNPGEFFIVPYQIAMPASALAVWLACFDEHKKIYLVGYERTLADGTEQHKMINSVEAVMRMYENVEFINVTNTRSPDKWREQRNFTSMTVEQYISYCDV